MTNTEWFRSVQVWNALRAYHTGSQWISWEEIYGDLWIDVGL